MKKRYYNLSVKISREEKMAVERKVEAKPSLPGWMWDPVDAVLLQFSRGRFSFN